jgi:hypothetical protein
MLANIVGSLNNILPTLASSKVVGATCKMVTVETDAGLQDRSFLQINTVFESPLQMKTSSVRFEEIIAESLPATKPRKRKAKAPMSVVSVRRSDRIEKLKVGFRNGGHAESSQCHNANYSAVVIDDTAPPPPYLPKDTLKSLGTGPCQMHPGDVSDENLDYDSTNDSIE